MRSVLGVLVAVYFVSLSLFACTCDPPPVGGFEEAVTWRYNQSGVVFAARAISVITHPKRIKLIDGTVKIIPLYSARFAVKEKLKGNLVDVVTADTGTGAGDCSFGRIIEGAEYLVYANARSRQIVDFGSCSGTSEKPPNDSSASLVKQYNRELAIVRKLRQAK